MASSERIFELLDSEPEAGGGAWRPARLKGEIEFRNVWFSYGEEQVLRDVSFRAAPGESIALVGATGAGKSTIIHLLCRFYEIDRGAILIDRVDLREWDVEALRRRIGLVQQDVFLFAGDVGRNIGLERPGIDPARIERAAHHANADRDTFADTGDPTADGAASHWGDLCDRAGSPAWGTHVRHDRDQRGGE